MPALPSRSHISKKKSEKISHEWDFWTTRGFGNGIKMMLLLVAGRNLHRLRLVVSIVKPIRFHTTQVVQNFFHQQYFCLSHISRFRDCNNYISYTPQNKHGTLKMEPWKRRFLLETIICRFHVKFRGCNCIWVGKKVWFLQKCTLFFWGGNFSLSSFMKFSPFQNFSLKTPLSFTTSGRKCLTSWWFQPIWTY